MYRSATTQEAVQDLGSIAAAAPNTPAYYYHFPGLYGVNLAMVDLVNYALGPNGTWPTLAGVKYIDSNFQDLTSAALLAQNTYKKPLNWYIGTGILLQSFAFAGSAPIPQGSPIYSVQMNVTKPIWEGVQSNDWSKAASGQLRYFEWGTYTNCPAAGRALYQYLYNFDIGPSRRPNTDCTPAQTQAMVQAMQAAGLLPVSK